MKKGAWMLLLLVAGLFCLILWIKGEKASQSPANEPNRVEDRVPVAKPEAKGPAVREDGPRTERREGLNREARSLIYSKHARCRMGCRQISEDEVMDILRNGRINYAKSDMRGSPDPKYAIEGNTADGQEVRIVFANSPRGIVVVTVIDLGREWKCNCK